MTVDELLKKNYKESENSVPVNEELKAKLISTARLYEEQRGGSMGDMPVIRVNGKNKRVYFTKQAVMKAAALAACLAVCVSSAPGIMEKYFSNNSGGDVPPPAAVSTAAPAQVTQSADALPQSTTIPQTDKTERTAAPRAEKPVKTAAPASMPKSRQTAAPAGGGTAAKPEPQKSGASENAVSEPQRAGTPENAAAEPQTEGKPDTVPVIPAVPTAPAAPTAEPSKSADGIAPQMGDSTRDDLNRCLTAVGRQREKLDAWDAEISPYKEHDENLRGYYDSFSDSKAAYAAAADSYESEYGTGYLGEPQKGVDEYDEKLDEDSDAFESCRTYYRKSVNYIEMNELEENGEAASEETAEPEKETEGDHDEEE